MNLYLIHSLCFISFLRGNIFRILEDMIFPKGDGMKGIPRVFYLKEAKSIQNPYSEPECYFFNFLKFIFLLY